MTSNHHLLQQVDLLILNQNWDEIRKVYQTLAQKINSDSLSTDQNSDTVYNTAGSVYKFTQYNMNTFGSVLRTDDGLSADWDTWCGPMLNRLCPWYHQAQVVFKDLTLQTITWSVTYRDIKLHVDPKVGRDQLYGQAKINYIVSAEDTSAATTVYDQSDPSIAGQYPSTPGTAWLLNTDHPHEMKCSGRREVLQFKFLNSFEEVARVLKKIGPIRFDARQ